MIWVGIDKNMNIQKTASGNKASSHWASSAQNEIEKNEWIPLVYIHTRSSQYQTTAGRYVTALLRQARTMNNKEWALHHFLQCLWMCESTRLPHALTLCNTQWRDFPLFVHGLTFNFVRSFPAHFDHTSLPSRNTMDLDALGYTIQLIWL